MIYEVGKRAFMPTREDSIRFQVTDAGCVLLLMHNKPNAKEKRRYKSTPQIKFCVANDIIFLLARFGDAPWMDAPFYKGLSRFAHLDVPGEGQGLMLHFMYVDSSTGILLEQRLIGLDHDMSCRLIAAIATQPTIPNYDYVLDSTYAQYTTRALVEMADAQC